jgi:hypothetical protein
MTAEQIVTIVTMFMSAWPWDEWTDERHSLWCDALESLYPAVAAVAARMLVRTRLRPPTIAEFLAEAQSESERQRMGAKVLTPPDRSGPAPALARVRQVIRDAFATRPVHDHHGGWRTCPTCSQYPPKAPTGNPMDYADA